MARNTNGFPHHITVWRYMANDSRMVPRLREITQWFIDLNLVKYDDFLIVAGPAHGNTSYAFVDAGKAALFKLRFGGKV